MPPVSPTRPRRFWPRFTLRVLLVFVTLVGVGLGYWTHRARLQRRIVERIEATGGMVCYERDGPAAPEPRNFAVEWLAGKLSRDHLEGVTTAFVHNREVIRELGALQGLDALTIHDGQLRDEDLLGLEQCKRLRYLQIGDAYAGDGEALRSQIGDKSLHLIARLPNLEIAHLHGRDFTANGIDALTSAPKLQQLTIDCCAASVQANDFEEIKRFGRIQSLVAWRSKWAGRGMEKIIEW